MILVKSLGYEDGYFFKTKIFKHYDEAENALKNLQEYVCEILENPKWMKISIEAIDEKDLDKEFQK